MTSTSSSTVVPLTSNGNSPLVRKISSFNGLLPRTLSSGRKNRLSFRHSSPSGSSRAAAAAGEDNISIPGSPSPKAALTREESKLLMERILLVLRHLRARVLSDTQKRVLVGSFVPRSTPGTEFAPAAKEIAYSDFLSTTLASHSIETLVGVVKLCFQTQELPLLDLDVGKALEGFYAQQGGRDEVDGLRLALERLPKRTFDILTQLVAVLQLDDATGAQAYSWGPLLFLPRFDLAHTSEQIKAYEQQVDVIKWSQMSVTLTQLMVQHFASVFPPTDDKVDRLVGEMTESVVVSVHDVCRVTFAFQAEQPHELTVDQGQLLKVLERGEDGWWTCQNEDGQSGLVPESYVEEEKAPAELDATSLSMLNANSEIIDEQIAEMELNLQRLVQLKEAKRASPTTALVDNLEQTFCSDYLPSSVMGPPPPPPPCERPKSLQTPIKNGSSAASFTSPMVVPTTVAAVSKSVTFEKLDDESEKRADAYKVKGNEKLGNGEYVWAVECYTQALEISPRGPNSHLFYSNRAAAHMHLQDYDAAIADCNRAVQLNPGFAKAYSRLAQAQLSMGRLADARRSATQALELDPGSEIVRATLGKIAEYEEQAVEETVQV